MPPLPAAIQPQARILSQAGERKNPKGQMKLFFGKIKYGVPKNNVSPHKGFCKTPAILKNGRLTITCWPLSVLRAWGSLDASTSVPAGAVFFNLWGPTENEKRFCPWGIVLMDCRRYGAELAFWRKPRGRGLISHVEYLVEIRVETFFRCSSAWAAQRWDRCFGTFRLQPSELDEDHTGG